MGQADFNNMGAQVVQDGNGLINGLFDLWGKTIPKHFCRDAYAQPADVLA